MKIHVVIPLWKRPEVTKFCFDRFFKSKHDVKVTCVISEDEYKKVCEDYGFDWVWAENNPLGDKINTGIKKALESEFDYLMMMNSDDVISSELIDKVYEPYYGKPFFGINRVTYVNFKTNDALDFQYSFTVLGIGKMIRRDVVENAFKGRGWIYRPELNKCLDDTMMDGLIRHQNVFPAIVQYDGQLAWDFKSETNIWPWEHFKRKGKPVCYKAA